MAWVKLSCIQVIFAFTYAFQLIYSEIIKIAHIAFSVFGEKCDFYPFFKLVWKTQFLSYGDVPHLFGKRKASSFHRGMARPCRTIISILILELKSQDLQCKSLKIDARTCLQQYMPKGLVYQKLKKSDEYNYLWTAQDWIGNRMKYENR